MKPLAKILGGVATFIGLVALSGFVVRRRMPSYGTSEDARVSLTAALDGVEFHSTSTELAEVNVLAYFGGVELDLRHATPAPGATIRLQAVFGGIDVLVPTSWRVELIAKGGASGIENLTNPDEPADGPLVIVDATAVFAGIEIHERAVVDGS